MHLNAPPNIDWDQVKSRLVAGPASTGVDGSYGQSADLDELFAQRSRQLAVRPVSDAGLQAARRGLVFRVAGERLAIDVRWLVEVLPFTRCALLPGARIELLGAINVRGHICSVLDLARILDLPIKDDRPAGYIVLFRRGTAEVGLRVDGVEQVAPIAVCETGAARGEGDGWASQYLLSRTPGGAGVLDLEAVCSHPVFTAAEA